MTHGGLLTDGPLAGIMWRAAQAGAHVHSCVKLCGMHGLKTGSMDSSGRPGESV